MYMTDGPGPRPWRDPQREHNADDPLQTQETHEHPVGALIDFLLVSVEEDGSACCH
jgi:hypothetical protein